jgi:Ceramidase
LQALSVKSRYKTPDAQSGPVARMWSTPVDLYCERVTPSFWAEPLNALSNIAFLIAAYAAYNLWRRDGKGDPAILALIVVVVAVGLGSFAFHTLATQGAMLLDVTPIGFFIYGYFLLALRRFLLVSWPLALTLLGWVHRGVPCPCVIRAARSSQRFVRVSSRARRPDRVWSAFART